MTPASRLLVANIMLACAFVILAVILCSMAGWIPRILPPQPFTLFAFFLAIVAARVRRASRVR